MNDRLDPMDPGKRERLLRSAYQEFGENRYGKASTNEIVKRAKISKGLLYHYFSSKKELFDYLCEKAFTRIVDAIESEMDWEENDLFERLKNVALIKFRIGEEEPYLLPFYTAIYLERQEAAIHKRIETYTTDLYRRIYVENVDLKKFKADVDVTKAIDIVRWSIEKYGEEAQNVALQSEDETDYNALINGIDAYLAILKHAFYNENGEIKND